jgi:hypothetical protein
VWLLVQHLHLVLWVPPLDPDTFCNKLASILGTYHVLDAVLLNSALHAPLQPADFALLHAMHTLPLPGTPTTAPDLARSTPLPATGPAPVTTLEELLNDVLCAPFWAAHMSPVLTTLQSCCRLCRHQPFTACASVLRLTTM